MMITKLHLARFTVYEKVVTDGRMYPGRDRRMDVRFYMHLYKSSNTQN